MRRRQTSRNQPSTPGQYPPFNAPQTSPCMLFNNGPILMKNGFKGAISTSNNEKESDYEHTTNIGEERVGRCGGERVNLGHTWAFDRVMNTSPVVDRRVPCGCSPQNDKKQAWKGKCKDYAPRRRISSTIRTLFRTSSLNLRRHLSL